jgi:hypothetical protein
LRALVELVRKGGDDKKRATSTLKSAADVLRGLSTVPKSVSIRVPAIIGKGSIVIGVTKFCINALAPDGVIAEVQAPVLAFATTGPTRFEVLEEATDEEDGDLVEEQDLARAAELQDMLKSPVRDGPKTPLGVTSDEEEMLGVGETSLTGEKRRREAYDGQDARVSRNVRQHR